ncbi:MAG TPA: SDR family NAD(P)-dependent oxidoreductase [Devosia sp.]|nr:SDR family NAD(P)-dependent oxidoreductase [Devosia sp.]
MTGIAVAFPGRVAAVTGCFSAFGQTIARLLLAQGLAVHGCDIEPGDGDALEAAGAVLSRVDLADRAAARGWVAGIERAEGSPVTLLVNNAGGVAGQSAAPMEDVPDHDWDRLIAINLTAAAALSAACIPGMKAAGGGAIVNIASGAASRPSLTGVQAYCAAKHGLLGLTRQLAHELGPFAIRVNCISPGFVQTNVATRDQWEAMGREKRDALLAATPLRRLGTPQDVALAVLFMASDWAGFVTGQNLAVNGGR